MALFALLAIRLSFLIVSISLPHAANGRFKAMISCDPVPGFGRFKIASGGPIVNRRGTEQCGTLNRILLAAEVPHGEA
jgi:hypothetical protein